MGFDHTLIAHFEHRNVVWAMTASLIAHMALFLALSGVNAEFRATAPYQSIEVSLSSVASPASLQASEPRLQKDRTVSSDRSVFSDAPDNDKSVKPAQENLASATSQGEMVT
ncbi:MAG: hypothetical protein OEY67_00325, partial [Gammaproteobacteria bacterium]|nr:hypothetical protein [Gammaproteobacteria bacterium]